jgi:hypothetical protein
MVCKSFGMGHHAYLYLAQCPLFDLGDSHDPELAALFTEDDRVRPPTVRDDDYEEFRYQTSVANMRDRLQVQGLTMAQATADLERAFSAAPEDSALGRLSGTADLIDRYERWIIANSVPMSERYRAVVASMDGFADFTIASEGVADESYWRWQSSHRGILRILLERVPDDAMVSLDLSELTGCCVGLDPTSPLARRERDAQLARARADAPLIVLTEGVTDSELLSHAMAITHPHLVGYVNFIDFAGTKAEGSASVLAKTVRTFIAAGVANRFIAIADNDTAAHTDLYAVKREVLPANCRVVHYPHMTMLESYPTLGPYGAEPVLANVNGSAGALELYLGRDVLEVDGHLPPVQWTGYSDKVGRYQGVLPKHEKDRVQRAFAEKLRLSAQEADWAGIRAIVDVIVHAFD